MRIPVSKKKSFESWFSKQSSDLESIMRIVFGLNHEYRYLWPQDQGPFSNRCRHGRVRYVHMYRSLMKHHYKEIAFPGRDKYRMAKDGIEKVEYRLYVGLDSKGVPQRKPIKVSRFFVSSLSKRDSIREAEDSQRYRLEERIRSVRGKVFESRSFPPSLRAIIFERDKFCCRKCGIHRDDLIKRGSHLQIDHMLAVEDGGLTCYENGETLCRECNIAKHHTKEYLRAVETIQADAG